MTVSQSINPTFNSNTFILSKDGSRDIWLIDIGTIDELLRLVKPSHIVQGVFLTHAHYDHIYFLNDLKEIYPSCEVFSSQTTKEELLDPKKNLSFFHDQPVSFHGHVTLLNDGQKVMIYENIHLSVTETPGHNEGCLTFVVSDYIFTGDSFIPDHAVVTKLKGGNKERCKASLTKIFSLFTPNTILCPGHGPTIPVTSLTPGYDKTIV